MCVCVCVCVWIYSSALPFLLLSSPCVPLLLDVGGGYLGARVPVGVCPRKIHTTPCTKQSSHTSQRFLYHG